ncbi:MAG: hypothetical protein ABI670_03630 [Chloroflexota bacterium]
MGSRGELTPLGDLLMAIYNTLRGEYGPQAWWPSHTGSTWEIMLGAVLTQHTTWTNVELSLGNMIAAWGLDSLSNPDIFLSMPDDKLAEVLRPTGFFASKPRTLRGLAGYVANRGGVEKFANSRESTSVLREELLRLWGIGPETADAILLYGLGRATFIADAYALRLASRWGLARPTAGYEELRSIFMDNLPHDPALFNEYHALIIVHGKNICRPKARCEVCPLNRRILVRADDEIGWQCPKLFTASGKIGVTG